MSAITFFSTDKNQKGKGENNNIWFLSLENEREQERRIQKVT